ncbi:MAG: purine-nucleoside phosphorylase [Mycoplasma sp.]
MSKIPTAHIEAKLGDFAKVVLMPGDPLRAKYIADNFLENVKQVNGVRGMLGFTGTYQGSPVSVMGHGMGLPSIGIYSYELFSFYDVETIIRIGSCGSFHENLDLGSLILGETATSFSTYAEAMGIELKDNLIDANQELTNLIQTTAQELKIPLTTGTVLSSDAFYGKNNGPKINAMIDKGEIACVEMEAYALYINANITNKEAITLLTVSDSLVNHKEMTSEQRQNGFTTMMKLALEVAKKKAGN